MKMTISIPNEENIVLTGEKSDLERLALKICNGDISWWFVEIVDETTGCPYGEYESLFPLLEYYEE